YKTNISTTFDANLIIYCVSLIIFIAVTASLIISKTSLENSKKGVIVQALFRGNFVLLAIPMVTYVYGAEKLGSASIAVAVIVPLFNILSVFVLEGFRGGKIHPLSIAKSILKNPLILGVICGIIVNILHIPVPSFLQTTIKDIASITTPLALIALGGTIKFSSVGGNLKYLIPTILMKIVIIPFFAVAIGYMLGFREVSLFTILVAFGVPVAVASYSMAANMGGDEQLAGQLVAISALASMFTLFIFIFTLSFMGLL
ncbi:MAG: AEC family transporter, partial [Anaerotignaceae bacterium]